MDEKYKAMQEEKKEAMDGVMSDDELDAVGGGMCACLDGMGNSNINEAICECLDGLGASRRPDINGDVEIVTSSNVEPW